MKKVQDEYDADDVKVTSAFLNLVGILHASRTRYISESNLAKDLGLAEPEDWRTRCENLFFKEFSEQAKLVGLKLNEISFSSLMDLKLDEELNRTNFDVLPLMFTFNPWLDQGKGGIKRVELETVHAHDEVEDRPGM